MINIFPLRDMQDQPVRAYCRNCKAELFEYDTGDLCPGCKERRISMDAKMERVIALSKQLQEAVNECGSVLAVNVESAGSCIKSQIHVLAPEEAGIGPLTFDRKNRELGQKWYHNDDHGIRIIGAVYEEEMWKGV